ncbi:MAG: hypothetical protein JXL97_00845 [Bacteroidales bacterium]|nr:hypothetical protein [Bacteroidales bacterium]
MKISFLYLVLIISFYSFVNLNNCFCQSGKKKYNFLTDTAKREIIYYSSSDYKSFRQVWAISQCNDKILFGTTTGITIFQNNVWKNDINIKDSTIVRAIFTDKDENIFIGCANDFGYIDTNNNYVSISKKFNLVGFNDIWTVFSLNSEIYFSSFSKIFCINFSDNGNNIKLLETIDTKSNRVSIINKKVYSVQNGNIFELKKKKLKFVSVIENKYINFILPFNRNNLLYANWNKLMFFDENKKNDKVDKINNYLKINDITKFYTFYQLDKNTFLISYYGDKNGILILNFKNILANINLDYKVYSMFFDSYNNLWLGTENGIYCIKSK